MSLPVTRCYPIPPLTPLLATVRNAMSPVPELGAPAAAQLMERMRPRVARYVAPLVLGLRTPSVDAALCTEHALVTTLAQLDRCTACTDDAFWAWCCVRATAATLELHRDLREAERRETCAA